MARLAFPARRLACALVVLLALALAPALAAPERAEASELMYSVMQDDNQLVYGSWQQREQALEIMQSFGVDAVRVTVLWEAVVGRRRPRNPADPRSYQRSRWDRYDDLVRSATRRGMIVYFSVTAPGPPWAHETTRDRANRRTWKPKPREWSRFMTALGRRYSGRYRDENQDRRALPRVDWWGVFNEPNQGGWLTPQTVRTSAGTIPMSPVIYRDLLVEGANALLRTGHRDAVLMFGETAPLGVRPEGERRPLRPALFLRELFCLDARFRRYRGRAARARKCERVSRLSVLERFPRLAYGHHPYTKTLPPTQRDPHPDAISMGNLRALPALLDRIAARSGLIPPGVSILLTEFGYETNPPDPFNGVSEERQAEYLNVGDYIAFQNPRVFANTQFQLIDVPPRREFQRDSREYWFTFQSGLLRADGQPKPSALAYLMPFEIRPAGGANGLFWGQVRFTPNGAQQTVYLQLRQPDGQWQTAGAPVPVENHFGFWQQTRQIAPGQVWRAVWTAPDFGDFRISREITIR
jgi:hypothetical protein